MPPHRRFQAPAGNGEVLAAPGFDAVPGLVEANRRQLDRDDVTIGGLSLRELRALARREVLEAATSPGTAVPGRSTDAPLLLAGHQPELSHPGVWVKNFALNGLARKLGGTPLNLIVDNDTLKSTLIHLPIRYSDDPPTVVYGSVPFDDGVDLDWPFEQRDVRNEAFFRSFPERIASYLKNWPFEPLLAAAWRQMNDEPTLGERFAATRRQFERDWGCRNEELHVSELSQTVAFGRFVGHILRDLARFQAVFNSAVQDYRYRNKLRSHIHPVPDLVRLAGDWLEAPFWARRPDRRRGRLFIRQAGRKGWFRVDDREEGIWPSNPDQLAEVWPPGMDIRPRALTLTLFARVCLGDFFIHGIGGGKYDEVTDAIIRDYFGIEPPAYQVLSATLHLPLPGFPATHGDVKQAGLRVRDLIWNPQRHLDVADRDNPDVQRLLVEKDRLTANEPPYADHPARRNWFRDLQRVTERLRPFVAGQLRDAEASLTRTRAEAHANRILRRRDYAWVLYPEDTLRPFLQRFLKI